MSHRRLQIPKRKYLETQTPVQVRFQEVDVLRMVWHGHYLSYFEVARIAFGQKHGLHYTDFLDAGLLIPVVQATCDYIQSATFHDELIVTTRLYHQVSAKLHYYFEVHRAADHALLARGETFHVFTDVDNALSLTIPPFMADWYARWEPEMIEHV